MVVFECPNCSKELEWPEISTRPKPCDHCGDPLRGFIFSDSDYNTISQAAANGIWDKDGVRVRYVFPEVAEKDPRFAPPDAFHSGPHADDVLDEDGNWKGPNGNGDEAGKTEPAGGVSPDTGGKLSPGEAQDLGIDTDQGEGPAGEAEQEQRQQELAEGLKSGRREGEAPRFA